MKRENPTISDAEMDVLKTLWEKGPGTVREVAALLARRKRSWAYTTVQTLLGRLEGKGYVACDRGHVPHVFGAAVSRDKLVRRRLMDLSHEFCNGETSPLVMALVRDRYFTKDEIAQFRKIIEDLEPGGGPGNKKGNSK